MTVKVMIDMAYDVVFKSLHHMPYHVVFKSFSKKVQEKLLKTIGNI